MRISPVCWWATPHRENDALLRVGHELRSLTKPRGAAVRDANVYNTHRTLTTIYSLYISLVAVSLNTNCS